MSTHPEGHPDGSRACWSILSQPSCTFHSRRLGGAFTVHTPGETGLKPRKAWLEGVGLCARVMAPGQRSEPVPRGDGSTTGGYQGDLSCDAYAVRCVEAGVTTRTLASLRIIVPEGPGQTPNHPVPLAETRSTETGLICEDSGNGGALEATMDDGVVSWSLC